jgi:transcriptional regulator with XRE-family HTH domain
MHEKFKFLLSFGSSLKSARIAKGYSQEELGHRANLHRTYIGMVERGEKNITLYNIYKISNALDIKTKELL